jgi:hypothetical protein
MIWTQDSLRALAGLILLILCLFSTYQQNETDSVRYTIIALAGFLVGGALLQKTNNKE